MFPKCLNYSGSSYNNLLLLVGFFLFPYKLESVFGPYHICYHLSHISLCIELCLQVAVAVLVSWMIFKNPISGMNAVGCGVTLVGCTFYGYIRHLLSQQLPGTPRASKTPPRTPRGRMELQPLVNDKLDDKV